MQEVTAPQIKDFSKDAIRQVVRKACLDNSLTIFPPVIGILCAAGAALFGANLLFIGTALGFIVSGANVMITALVRKDTIATTYIRKLKEQMRQHEQMMLESLEQDLKECMGLRSVNEYAKCGIEQLRRMQEEFENVQHLLEEQLADGSLMFGRFSGATEQVYLGTLDNLKKVEFLLRNASSIDLKYIDKRLAALEGKNSETSSKEKQALQEQKDLFNEQIKKIEKLLSMNEESMAKIQQTTAAIAELPLTNGLAAGNYEMAIKQLQELAVNVKEYK